MWNGREETVLLEVASPLEATTTIEETEAAANEAKRTDRPWLTIFTDGSQLENGATGYAVAWKYGHTWKGHKTHLGWGQGAYDAECAARESPASCGSQEPHARTGNHSDRLEGGHRQDGL